MDASPAQPVPLLESGGRAQDVKLAAQLAAITILTTSGGALSRFVMIGLLGVPMFVTGVIGLLALAIRLSARSVVSQPRSIVGLLVVIGGWLVISFGVAVAPDGFFRGEDFYRHIHSFQLTGNPLTPWCGALGPVIFVAGVWLRTGWRPVKLIVLWLVLMMVVPLTVLAFYFMRGLPITA